MDTQRFASLHRFHLDVVHCSEGIFFFFLVSNILKTTQKSLKIHFHVLHLINACSFSHHSLPLPAGFIYWGCCFISVKPRHKTKQRNCQWDVLNSFTSKSPTWKSLLFVHITEAIWWKLWSWSLHLQSQTSLLSFIFQGNSVSHQRGGEAGVRRSYSRKPLADESLAAAGCTLNSPSFH